MITFTTAAAVLLPAVFVFAGSAFAQSSANGTGGAETAPSASTSLHRSADSAGNAVSNTYHAARTAVDDTVITGRVKLALHEDKLTHDSAVHVDTIAGVVTLSGSAPNRKVAERAVTLAKETRGVAGVKDAITVDPQSTSMR